MGTREHTGARHIGRSERSARHRLRGLFLVVAVAALIVPGAEAGASGALEVEGRVVVEHGDDFASGRSDQQVFIETARGRVRVNGFRSSELEGGNVVRARGRQHGSTLVLGADSSVETLDRTSSEPAAAAATAAAPVAKRVAVLLINFTAPTPTPTPTPSPSPSPSPSASPTTSPTASPTATPTATPTPSPASSPVPSPSPAASPSPTASPSPSPSPSPTPAPPVEPWTRSAVNGLFFTNQKSVASYFAEVSNGGLSMSGDVFGYYTLAVSTSTCDYTAWAKAARDAATAAGIDLAQYTNVVHAWGKQASCWWGGMGQVPGKYSWINGSMTLYVTSHELGHNFGAHHASTMTCTAGGVRVPLSNNCTVDEYGDPFDVMGTNAQRHVQAWHRRQLGFLGTTDQLTVTANGRYAVSTAQVAGGSPRILRIPRPSGDYYYLEFRQPYGLFDNFTATAAAVTGVMVRIAPDTKRVQSKLIDMHPATTTFSDAPLAVGETFTDTPNAISITTLSTTTAGASLRIQVGPDTVAPSTPAGLGLTATSTTSVRLSWTASTDDLEVTGYRVSRDGTVLGTTTSTSWSDEGLVAGTAYSYSVVALDGALNASLPANVARAGADVIAPSAPGTASASQTGQRTVVLSWTAATDNIGVSGYRVERNGSPLTTTTGTSLTDTSVTDGFSYRYSVAALDATGNVGPAVSADVSLPDVTAPTAPGSLGVTSPGASSALLSWTAASDNVAVTAYRVSRNGIVLGSTAERTWLDDGPPQGVSHSYAVEALDGALNVGAAAVASHYLPDTIAPTAPGAATASAATARSVSVAWGPATDNVGVAGYRVVRDGALLTTTTQTSFADATVVEGRSYGYLVSAVDAAGNVGPSTSATVYVPDVTAPTAPGSVAALALSPTSTRLTWAAATDNLGVTGYRVTRDGVLVATLAATATSFEQTGVPSDATYRYAVAAFDAAGNSGPATSADVTLVSVDLTPPSVPQNLRGQPLGKRWVSLTWSASTDNRSGTIRYVVFRDGVKVATVSTTSYSDRPAVVGWYSYKIRAIDAAGNKSSFTAPISVKARKTV